MESRKRKLKYELNHSGSTLLMVLICIAFIGILGSLILSVTMINLQMKRVETGSKDNFYYCETAMEEIRLGLEEDTSDAVKEAYQEVLSKYIIYAAKDESTRSKDIQQLVLSKLAKILKGNESAYINTDLSAIAAVFKSYLSMTKSDSVLTDTDFDVSLLSLPQFDPAKPEILIFKDVKVAFRQDTYITTITTDLKVTLPSFTFSEGSDVVNYSMNQPYEGYAIVADGKIISKNSSGENKITGNVYSGGKITVQDSNPVSPDLHKLTINGKYIASRGDIEAVDTAVLTIGDNGTKPVLWADNIRTVTTNLYTTDNTLQTQLLFNAICLVRDDLTLEGRNSYVQLNGAYVGYTAKHTVKGSAMMINGSGSSLLLGKISEALPGLSSLVLAGRAHVSVEDSILKSTTGTNIDPLTGESPADVNILTGESLAFKCDQRAYLIPGQYIKLEKTTTDASGNTTVIIKKAMHNPINEEDLTVGKPVVDVTDATDSTALDYFDYIKAKPYQYKIAAKQTATGGGDTLRYYYLNFASGQLADQFLADYMDRYSQKLQNLGNFKLGSVTLPDTAYINSAGNVMSYDSSQGAPVQIHRGLSSSHDDTETDAAIAGLSFQNINYNDVYKNTVLLNYKVSDLPGLYHNMIYNLSPGDASVRMQENGQVVDTTVLEDGISQISSTYTPKSTGFHLYTSLEENTWKGTQEDAKSIVILNGDAQIDAGSHFNGFFIASGNITIGSGARINGIIIAGKGMNPGTVTVQSSAVINGRIIAAGDVILKENCIVDCTGNVSFDTGLPVEIFLKNLFHNDGQLLWKLFLNPEISINITSSVSSTGWVNIRHTVTCENWRKNRN